MSYVVIGLILLTTAVAIVAYFTGAMGNVSGVVGSNIEQSNQTIVRNSCLRQKPNLCAQSGISGKTWAENAYYQGKKCSKLLNSVPSC